MAQQEQRTVVFSGNVQGVGFRYTTCRIADKYDVTGHVKNLSNGQVECVVEGTEREIDAFLNDLAGQMGSYIRDRKEQSAPPSNRYSSFSVAH
jgi:acylphosphatase